MSKVNNTIEKLDILNKKYIIFDTEYLKNDMDFKPFAPEFIKQLKELGFTLVLATVTTQAQIDIYCNKNDTMKFKLKLDDYFDLIIKKVFEDSLHGILASKIA